MRQADSTGCNDTAFSLTNRLRWRVRHIAASVLVAVAVAGCSGEPSGRDRSLDDLLTDDGAESVAEFDGDPADSAPLVLEFPGPGESEAGDGLRYLAADADPSTELGELRAQYLPVWSSDLDWGFPPEVCDSAWEYDAIAARDVFSDTAILGDPSIAVARSVMRYEYLYSRALSNPTALSQLCVAVGSMDPIRAENLLVLKSLLDDGSRRTEAAAYPDRVRVLAIGTGQAMAVACIESDYPESLDAEASRGERTSAPVRLQAYRLAVARGLEDTVIDISYRVSDIAEAPALDCRELDDYSDRWTAQVSGWIADGQLWTHVGRDVDVVAVCQPSQGLDEPDCPTEWPI